MFKLAPSLLAADFGNLAAEVIKIDKAGADYVHIDVMDGMFVPSISFGFPVIKSIRGVTELVFDVHLMIEEPIRYLQEFVEAGADIITVHAESCKHLHRTVTRIKELGAKACVALNPATPIENIELVLHEVDMVLIMTVNPGFGGQAFIPFTVNKIKALREMISKKGLEIDIQVDGGITPDNVGKVIEAGANVFVAGTSVFKGDVESNVKAFREVFESASSRLEVREVN